MEQAMAEPAEYSTTFVVRVTKKQSEPWKGNVIWVSERCEQRFTSMQELFQLMDGTLREAEK